MDDIRKEIELARTTRHAFECFAHRFGAWWPREYTWSQDVLQSIHMEVKPNGLCTEVGPHGFRCDWGRITALEPNSNISFLWQIGPAREPVPDPEKSSEVAVHFRNTDFGSRVVLEHRNFRNHGEGAGQYAKMMDGSQGWPYILDRFKIYCES